METKKIEQSSFVKVNNKKNLKIGSIVRVKIIDGLDKNNLWVELNGKKYVALLKGKITGNLFIAKVLKLSPKLELKYIDKIDRTEGCFNYDLIEKLINSKKSFIQDLIASDKYLVKYYSNLSKNEKYLKNNLKRTLLSRSILNFLSSKQVHSNEILEYYLLQDLYNFINYNNFVFLFPIRVGERTYLCNLKINCDNDGMDNSIFLTVFLKNEKKIGFFVFLDYKTINCSILTNDLKIEKKLRSNIEILIQSFKSLNYNREINVDFLPFSEDDFVRFNKIKKINIKM